MSNTLKLGNGQWATGKDTVLSFSDTNNNYKPLPFSFSRASSATVVNKDGLIETVGSGEPRIDFKDNTKGALKLEPTRRNDILYSQDFSQSSWVKIGGTVSLSNSLSPDGSLNAYRFYSSNSAQNTRAYQSHTLSAATYTFSVYAKKNGTNNKFKFSISDSSGQTLTPDFNLTDDWKRFEYTYTSSGGSGTWWVVNPSDTELGSEFDVLIYGAQLEQGSYATSYIPTSGSAVTRVADYLMLKSFQNTILNNGVSPFALFLDLQNYKLESNGNTGLNFYDESINYNTEGRAYLYNTSAGFGRSWSDNPVPFTNNSSVKLLWNYTSSTEGYVFSNGTKGGLNSGTATSGFDYLELKGQFNTLLINQILIYNTALTDAEAIALTS